MRVVNSLDSRGHRISHTRTFSYPGWDSNPHCFRSERNASCRLGYLGLVNVIICQWGNMIMPTGHSTKILPRLYNQHIVRLLRYHILSLPYYHINTVVTQGFEPQSSVSYTEVLPVGRRDLLFVQEVRFERTFTGAQTLCLAQLNDSYV